MNALVDAPAFAPFAISVAVLALHLLGLAALTGAVRYRHKQWVNPEDARTFAGLAVEADHPDVLRVRRAHQNALENAVPFFVVALVFVLVGASRSSGQIYMYTFVAARLSHSVFYMMGRQPFRTMCFVVGFLAIAGMAVRVLQGVV